MTTQSLDAKVYKTSNDSTVELDTVEHYPCWIHAVSFVIFVFPTLNSVACAYSLLLTSFAPGSNANSYVKWMNVTLVLFVIQGMLCGTMLPLVIFHRCGKCIATYNAGILSTLVTTIIFTQIAAFVLGIVALNEAAMVIHALSKLNSFYVFTFLASWILACIGTVIVFVVSIFFIGVFCIPGAHSEHFSCALSSNVSPINVSQVTK